MRVSFPRPEGVAVNMMPFVPAEGSPIAQYGPIVEACGVAKSRDVHFLTVSEHVVSSGAHRRGGIHTEAPRLGKWGGGWGGRGGVWMASTVAGSCRVWHFSVPPEQLGEGGCCAHLDIAGVPSRTLSAGELANFSDRTPHESLPLPAGTPRQFFRLVGPEVSLWFAEHSTQNPKCPLPAAIEVIYGNKFGATARNVKLISEQP